MPKAWPAIDVVAIGQLLWLRNAREAKLARRLKEFEERLQQIAREKVSAEGRLDDICRREEQSSPMRQMAPGKLVTGRDLLVASDRTGLIGRERSLAQTRIQDLNAECARLSLLLTELRDELSLARRKAARLDALVSLDP
ncbi:hypothetical protein [Sinorhizobium psoraleae]|uniref:Uncharacterized protein n=1 Tax=Sinorhizobium psoraleae TaxID=520838 RepID=A0ABT4KNG2_9HYPH|nr:hypothetical protein [Sinorhizobium psoraleae]MCZ4093501.1 hypothetical protein [Sinorhizobium psoraleae]